MNLPEGGKDETGTLEAEERLAFEDEDDSLPWLEDDAEYEEDRGFDARLIWITLAGLVVIGSVLFALWWLLRDGPQADAVADGSTIEAPNQPYKERPEDPGGRQVEGTGDTAYQVAGGESQRGRLADTPEEAASPSIDLEQNDSEGEADKRVETNSNVYVQIGAYTSRSDANDAWVRARGRYSVLSGMSNRVVEAQVNGATVYRLQAITSDRATGDATCRAIREQGGDCYIR